MKVKWYWNKIKYEMDWKDLMKVECDWKVIIVAWVAGIVCSMMLTGCDVESAGHEPIADPIELSRQEHMDYVKFDGHEYVRYTYLVRGSNCAIGGIAHSPKCPCMVNK